MKWLLVLLLTTSCFKVEPPLPKFHYGQKASFLGGGGFYGKCEGTIVKLETVFVGIEYRYEVLSTCELKKIKGKWSVLERDLTLIGDNK